MKKHIMLLLLAFVATMASAQDDHKSVELSTNQSEPIEVEFDCCKLFLSTSSFDSKDYVSLSVEVNNTDDYKILLFGHAFTEKDLKKQRPSIRFDRTSYGATDKKLELCKSDEGDDILMIEPSSKRTLTFENVNTSGMKLKLPLYIAKYKPKKFLCKEKYLILRRSIITVDVRFQSQPENDDLYSQLEEKYNELMEDLDGKRFCPNRSHKPSLANQEQPFKDRITEMLEEISDLKTEKKWRDRTEAYKPYKELKEKLEGIRFIERDCGIHGGGGGVPIPTHSCNYCNKSLSSVLNALQSAYRKLDTGASPSSVMPEVEALHAAWTNGKCPLNKRKKGDSSLSGQIDKYYSRIVNFKR